MMSQQVKSYDFVVFGATGFTGKFVAKELLGDAFKDYKCALAGRASSLDKLFKENSPQFEQTFARIVADCSDEPSIAAMCKCARVVINCVGPFRTFGEIVVRNCAENGANYIDICGEPEFLEEMELKYNDLAKKNGVSIVGACGFDSVPADFGVELLRQHCLAKGLVLTSVETFLKMKGDKGVGLHFTTFLCAVEGMSRTAELQSLRKKIASARKSRIAALTEIAAQKIAGWSEREKDTMLKSCGSRLAIQAGPFDHAQFPEYKAYAFPGADASVIRRSFQRRTEELYVNDTTNGEEGKKDEAATSFCGISPQIACYFVVPNDYTSSMKFKGGMMKFLSGYNYGRKLLLSYPSFFTHGIFTHEGPSTEQIKTMTYEFTFVGKAVPAAAIDPKTLAIAKEVDGKPTETCDVTMKWKGGDPGYVSTSRILLSCAVTLIEEKKKGDSTFRSGVLTPGFAFANTNLKDRILKDEDTSITFL